MESDHHSRIPMMWDAQTKIASRTSYGWHNKLSSIGSLWKGGRSGITYKYVGLDRQHYQLLRTMKSLEILLATSRVPHGSDQSTLPKFLKTHDIEVSLDYTFHPWMCLQSGADNYLPITLISKASLSGTGLTPMTTSALLQCLENAVKYMVSYDSALSEDSVDGLLSDVCPEYSWGTSIFGRVKYLTSAWEDIAKPKPLSIRRKHLRLDPSEDMTKALHSNTVITSSLLHLLPTDLDDGKYKNCFSFLNHVSACQDSTTWAPLLLQMLLSNTAEPPKGKTARSFYKQKDADMIEAAIVRASSNGNNQPNGILNKISDLLLAVGQEQCAEQMLHTKTWRGVNLLTRLADVYVDWPTANAQQLCYLALLAWSGYGAGLDSEIQFVSSRARHRYSWIYKRAFDGGDLIPPPRFLIQKVMWVASEWLVQPGSTYSYRVYSKSPRSTRACLNDWISALEGAQTSGLPSIPDSLARMRVIRDAGHLGFEETVIKLCKVGKRAHLKVLDKLFPPTGWTDNRHTTCRMSDVCWTILHPTSQSNPAELRIMTDIAAHLGMEPAGRIKILNSILSTIPVGTNNVLATSIVLSTLGQSPCDPVRAELFRRCFIFRPIPGQAAALKTISSVTRRTACVMTGAPIPDIHVARLAAFDMMFGRSANVTDWDVEIGNRCSQTIPLGKRATQYHNGVFPPLVSEREALTPPSPDARDDFQKRLDAHVRAIVAQIVNRKATKTTLEDFWRRRSEWMTSGSSSGATIDDTSFLPETASKRLRGRVPLSKRGWAEVTPFSHILKAFNSKNPREEATASEKMENGKARAIYGVTPEHYVINTYATQGLEERLKMCSGFEKGAEGIAAYAYDNKRAALSNNSNLEMTMLDYADFNRHHSPAHQASVFKALSDWGRANGACSDWIKANDWVAASKFNMYCKFPGNDRRKVLQGMFSGTRSTDLINTILNLAYFRVAIDIVREEYGLQPDAMYNVHQGDDVWISNTSSTWARLVLGVLKQLGLLFQPLKQMFGPRRGEYLRVMYSGGIGRGYLSRAIANFILRPVQNDVSLDPAAWAATLHDGVSTLLRRGLTPSAASALWRATIPYWTRIQAHPQDHQPVQYPWWVITNPRYLGGLSCSFPLGGDLVANISQPAPVYHLHRPAWLSEMPQQMTRDWIVQLSEKLPPSHKSIRSQRIKESILANSYSEALRLVDHRHSASIFKNDMSKWLSSNPSPRVQQGYSSLELSQKGLPASVRAGYFKEIIQAEGLSIGRRVNSIDSNAGISAVIGGVTGSWADATRNALAYRSSISQWLASSPFKSLEVASLAYGTSPLETLKLLAIQYPAHNTRTQTALSVLLPILNSGSSTLVDLVLSGSVGLGSHLVPHMSKNLLSFALADATDLTLSTYCHGGLDSPAAVARSVVYGLDCLVASCLKLKSTSLDAVLY